MKKTSKFTEKVYESCTWKGGRTMFTVFHSESIWTGTEAEPSADLWEVRVFRQINPSSMKFSWRKKIWRRHKTWLKLSLVKCHRIPLRHNIEKGIWDSTQLFHIPFAAGDERIELPPKVLETPIIPFDQSPILWRKVTTTSHISLKDFVPSKLHTCCILFGIFSNHFSTLRINRKFHLSSFDGTGLQLHFWLLWHCRWDWSLQGFWQIRRFGIVPDLIRVCNKDRNKCDRWNCEKGYLI